MKQEFRFESYDFDPNTKTALLRYAIDDLSFVETYRFLFDFADYDPKALDRALRNLFYIAGVSYYKTYLPEAIIAPAGLDADTAAFLQRTYEYGLGEFFYVNKLNPRRKIPFPVTEDKPIEPQQVIASKPDLLVGIGGGKDSLLSVELLRTAGLPVTTWSLNHRKQLGPLVDRIGTDHLWVERTWDNQLSTLVQEQGAYNGHVPISAIIAAAGTVVGVLSGIRDHVVSNEQSANEPTLEYQGVAINHQYSKSQMFERDYQQLLQRQFASSVRYYSLLRPLSELRVAELFSRHGFDTYRDVFSSCNRAYTHDSPGLFWDGTCPKCAFVYLILAPFIPNEALDAVIGNDLLADDTLHTTYQQLLGITGDKPLECVGEVKESRAAMDMMKSKRSGLEQYEYELPADYDFRALSSHEMPEEIHRAIAELISPRL